VSMHVRFTGLVVAVLLGGCALPLVEGATCRAVPALFPPAPTTTDAYLISDQSPTRLVLTAAGVSCAPEGLRSLTARATLTTGAGERVEATVVEFSRGLVQPDLNITVTVEVPPMPPGPASLRVFVEPSLAVLDAFLVSPVDRTRERGVDFSAFDCDSTALTSTGTLFCTNDAGTTVQRDGVDRRLPRVTQALVVGDVVWTMGRDGGIDGDLIRWRAERDGGLSRLESASMTWTLLGSVTETRALTDSAVWTVSGDGGLTAQRLRSVSFSTCRPAVLEPTGAWEVTGLPVCELVDGGCASVDRTSGSSVVPIAFDARRVWLFDNTNQVGGSSRPFLRSFTRPLQPGAAEASSLALFAGFVPANRQVPCGVQGERPLVLLGTPGLGLLVVRETERGLWVERFADVRFVEATRDWLIGAPERGVRRAWALQP
jgi:hypothetical protein